MTSSGPDVSGLRRATATVEPAAAIPPPRRRWMSRVAIPGALLVAFAGILLYAARDALRSRTDVRVVPVVVKASSAVSGAVTAQAAGWLEPDPFPIYVSALTDGVVQDVPVLEGERVEQGQVVARMVADDARLEVERARSDLADREARVDSARATLDSAQSDWDNPIERERAVAVTDAHVREAEAAVTTLDSDVEAQEARIAELDDQLRREQAELAAGATSEFLVTRTKLRLTTAKAVLESLRARRPAVRAGVDKARAERHAAREDARLRIPETLALADAKAALRRSEAERDRSRAVLEEGELRLRRMEIRAQRGGVVMRRLTSPGTKLMLAMDDPYSAHVVHLYDPKKLQVRVDVPLADAARVGVGQAARIVVEVLPDHVFEGEVTRIVHQADMAKNTLQVKVAVRDPIPELKPEMLARVQLVAAGGDGARRAERVFAPESLLFDRDGSRASAWVVDSRGDEAELRGVELGTAQEKGWIEVVRGLEPGDRLIDADPKSLSEGTGVNVVGESAGGASWR